MSVGMPAALKLEEFAKHLHAVFGDFVFQVGSSIETRQWRDVDVRVLLDQKTWDLLGLGNPDYPHDNARWVGLCLAFSALGKEMTGLPIDFQIQQLEWANEKFPKGGRSAIGCRSAEVTQLGGGAL